MEPDWVAWRPEPSGAHGMKAMALSSQWVITASEAPVFEVVPILHRHDRGEPLRLLELLEADIGNADVADLAFVA